MTRARTALIVPLALAALAGPAHAQPPPESVGGGGQQGQQGQIEAGKLSKVPKQTKFVEAEYPKEAFDKGIEADVVLLLDINAEGKVDSVGVAQPANPPGMGFDEAAMVAAQQFEFEPAEMDGKPIAVQITYRYQFTLKTPAPRRRRSRPRQPGAGTAPPAAAGRGAAGGELRRRAASSAARACRWPACW